MVLYHRGFRPLSHHLRVLFHALAAVVVADQGVAAHHQSDVLVVAIHLPVPPRFPGAIPGLGRQR